MGRAASPAGQTGRVGRAAYRPGRAARPCRLVDGMFRGVTAKQRVHEAVLASHARSFGQRKQWASDTCA